jgi:hypothetical protein
MPVIFTVIRLHPDVIRDVEADQSVEEAHSISEVEVGQHSSIHKCDNGGEQSPRT